MEFAPFDARHYPTLSVRDGYAQWAKTYGGVVQDEMDLRLLERLTTVAWHQVRRAIDLACGTGRIGRWLRARGVATVDGVDLTPEMLGRARDKGAYDRLLLADLRATGLPPATYDLAVEVLADEHLGEILPLYREAARLTRPDGRLVMVGYHPHFLLNGVPTHFNRAEGNPVAIQSHVHLFSDHVKAAHANGWVLLEMDEGVIDEAWLERKPKWSKYAGRPVSFAFVWVRTRPGGVLGSTA